jgi:hypothetical protein
VLLAKSPSKYHNEKKKAASVPAKVILAKRQAMQMVSVAQPLAQLTRDRAEPMFARVNCVLLISKRILSEVSAWIGREITHIGTRHIPEHVNDLPFGSGKSIKSQG